MRSVALELSDFAVGAHLVLQCCWFVLGGCNAGDVACRVQMLFWSTARVRWNHLAKCSGIGYTRDTNSQTTAMEQTDARKSPSSSVLLNNQPRRQRDRRRSPTESGAPTFNLEFDFIFRSARDRLHQYDSTSACGQWNATLIEDFRSAPEFMGTAEQLFGKVVNQRTNGECVASDGLSLDAVTIDLGNLIDLYFRLYFLDTPNGYGEAPAKLSVATDPKRSDCMLATLCCGLSEPDGDFWYPSTKRRSSVVLPDDYAWAYRNTRLYGPPTISSWMERRSQ